MNIIFEGDVTGISTVKTATSIDGNFYDLSGRRVTKPTKGLYIVNGKKVVMKWEKNWTQGREINNIKYRERTFPFPIFFVRQSVEIVTFECDILQPQTYALTKNS